MLMMLAGARGSDENRCRVTGTATTMTEEVGVVGVLVVVVVVVVLVVVTVVVVVVTVVVVIADCVVDWFDLTGLLYWARSNLTGPFDWAI